MTEVKPQVFKGEHKKYEHQQNITRRLNNKIHAKSSIVIILTSIFAHHNFQGKNTRILKW